VKSITTQRLDTVAQVSGEVNSCMMQLRSLHDITDFAVSYGVGFVVNTDFFTFYCECQRPVALQLQLHGQRDKHS